MYSFIFSLIFFYFYYIFITKIASVLWINMSVSFTLRGFMSGFYWFSQLRRQM